MLTCCAMGLGDTGALLIRARGIATLRGVLDSGVARDLLALLELLEEERPDAGAVARVFGRLWEGLALEEERLLRDAWQSHLVGRVLDTQNPFSLGAEKGEISARSGRCSRWTRLCCSAGSSPQFLPWPASGSPGRIRSLWTTLRGARSRASSRLLWTGERAQSFWPATTPGMEPDPTAATELSSGEKGDSWPSLVLTL